MSEKRKLGNSDLSVTSVGLGCMGFSHAYGAPTEKSEAVKMIRKAFDMGYNFFDTAECYIGTNADGSMSFNEKLVGEALRDVRDKVVIATKFGVEHSSMGLLTDSSPETIRQAVEGSLVRLGVDCIDLYYQHRVDPKVEPEIVADVMKELIKEGKIRYWGISETDEAYLRRANAVCPVTAIQNRYSMLAREHEKLFPVLEELNVAFVAFSPLGNGFLSGKYDENSKFEDGVDFRSHMPQYTKDGFEAGRELMELLGKMAEEKNATSGQISLAWMMCKKPYIIPIPGSRKEERLKENIGSKDVILSDKEIAVIDDLLDKMNMPVYGQSAKK
ncbi:MAG: aldo/keto reductase [Oscillospiraceae bacterium]|nr:aldo/keto reductase [Oscillospiraceae bacterium]